MTTYTKQYILNGQPVEADQLSPEMDHQCVYFDGDAVVYVEDIKDKCLAAIESYGDQDDLDASVKGTVETALANGSILDVDGGTNVNIYFDPTVFDLGFTPDEEWQLTLKAKFVVTRDESGALQLEQDDIEAYVLEVIQLEPMQGVVKRGIYNAAKELLFFEYPFVSLDEASGMPKECGGFIEATEKGEQFIVQGMDDEVRQALQDGSHYILPANRDAQLDALEPYISPENVVYTDMNQQPITTEEELAQAEQFMLINLGGQDQIKTADLISEHAVCQSEIYNVPVELHWHAYHAYLRQMSLRMMLISQDGYYASNYIKVYSPVSEESLPGIALGEGESRIHTTTFHLNGNLISHECTVLSAEQMPVRNYMLKSPSDFEVVHEQHIESDA